MTKDIDIVKKYHATMQSASKREIQFDIPYSEFKRIYNSKKCHYTGKRLIHGFNFSLDRVDNEKGYVSGNVVACDKDFNLLKSNLTIDQIELMSNGVKKFYLKNGKNSKTY